MRRALLLLIASALLAAVAVPASAGAASAGGGVTYGLGDAPGTFARCTLTNPYCCDADTGRCNRSSLEGYYDNPLFQRLTAPASAHRISEVRLFVDYDAVQEWNGSVTSPGCTFSRVLRGAWNDPADRVHFAGQSWRNLLAGVIEARAEGLTPVVAITGYGVSSAIPPWDKPAPDPTTIGGYWEQRCGIQGVLGALAKLPAWQQPHIWEAFNEPNLIPIYKSTARPQAQSCAISAEGQPDGAAKAACGYVEAARTIHQFAGRAGDTVIAGTFSNPTLTTYLSEYSQLLRSALPPAQYPATWSVHDYGDVTRAYGGPTPALLGPFDQALAADSGGAAHDLWVTEAGTLLTDRATGGRCPATAPDAAGTLGACVNGQPARQAAAAAGFFALSGAATQVPITHLFWYQWASEPDWDSALADAGGGPRAGWCAFFGSGTCSGNPGVA